MKPVSSFSVLSLGANDYLNFRYTVYSWQINPNYCLHPLYLGASEGTDDHDDSRPDTHGLLHVVTSQADQVLMLPSLSVTGL